MVTTQQAYYEAVLSAEDLEFFGYDCYNPVEFFDPWYDRDDAENEMFPT